MTRDWLTIMGWVSLAALILLAVAAVYRGIAG